MRDTVYFEQKYLKNFPYIEKNYSKKIIMLCESFQRFSDEDKLDFMELLLLFCTNSSNSAEKEIIINLLINSYFLASYAVKKAIINFVVSCKDVCNTEIVELFYNDFDPSIRLYFYNALNDSGCSVVDRLAIRQQLDDTVIKLSGDVLFIIPNYLKRNGFLQPPIDALLAARVLKDSNLKVHVLDLRVENRPLYKYELNYKSIYVSMCPYDLIQNYFVDYKYEHSISLINFLAKKYKNIYAYGPYFSFDNGTTKRLLDSCVNIIVGEIEYEIKESIEQIFHLNIQIDIEKSYPAYELVNLNKYYTKSNDKEQTISPWVAVLANRGCPFDCAFCYCFFGKKQKKRSVESLIMELRELERRNVKNIFFIDSTFTLDKSWVLEFCTQYKNNNLIINYQIETRIDCLDVELINHLSKAGCKKIWFGLESLSDGVLSKCNKHFNEKRIYEKLNTFKDSGVKLGGFFIVGLPFETKTSFDSLFNKLSAISFVDIQLIMFTPRPNTPFFELAKEQYPFIEEDIRYISCVRGIVKNKIKRSDIYNKISDFYKR